jgi:RimJ/RimL family protein N-acetyltransferase
MPPLGPVPSSVTERRAMHFLRKKTEGRDPDRATATLLEVRAATPDDAEALRYFKRTALAETEYLLQGLEDFDDRTEAERDLVQRFLAQPHCLLLVAVVPGGRVVGLCSIVGGHLWRTRHVGIMSVAVLQAHWGRGIASRLMRAALDWALGNAILEKLSLQVHASNHAARRLYQRLGFVEEGRLRREARVGQGFEDLVPMGLQLRDGGMP